MKEIFDDIVRNENIPLQTVKLSNVDQLIIDHHQPSHDFHTISHGEEDDGFEDELSDLHQERMRNKIQELNAQFAADPTPVVSDRQRHVTFKENLVDIMDSFSPQHSPDLLGDEDINEKSLEEIQMLSQKLFLEDLSFATSDNNDGCRNFENSQSEEGCEAEYPPTNISETVELYETGLENKNDRNENEDHICEAFNENNSSDRNETFEVECHSKDCNEKSYSKQPTQENESGNETFDEVEWPSKDREEPSHSKQQIYENESSNFLQEKIGYSDETSLNENVENKGEEVNGRHTNAEESQNEKGSDIEADNSDINGLNLYYDTACEETNDNSDHNPQFSLTSNADEVKPMGINQNNICPKGLSENKTPNIEQMLNKLCLDENKVENVGQTLTSELEMNSSISDYEMLECQSSQFRNTNNSFEKVTSNKESLENAHVSTDCTKSEGSRTVALEQTSKLDGCSVRKSVPSSDKSFISTSAVTKSNKPNINSKSKASSKLKPANSMESQQNKRLPNYKGNPRSPYGLSKEECKDLMSLRKEKILEMKRKEKEEEENRIQKQEEANKAFQAWLSKKKTQEKNKDKKPAKVVATLKEVPTKEESKKSYGDAEEAFQAWLKRKEQQISREEILRQLEEEEKALTQCRISKREATKAFNKWLAKKQREENELGKKAAPRGNYLHTLPLQPHHIEAFAQTFHAYLGNTM